MRAKLLRENKGWVFVSEETLPVEVVAMIEDYWKRVSDLPIIVFGNCELFVREDGSINVKEIIIE